VLWPWNATTAHLVYEVRLESRLPVTQCLCQHIPQCLWMHEGNLLFVVGNNASPFAWIGAYCLYCCDNSTTMLNYSTCFFLLLLLLLSLAPQPSLGLGLLHKIQLNFLKASQQFTFSQGNVVSPASNPHPGGPGLCIIYIPQRQGGSPF
jgi:hypothetical protein